MRKWVIWVLEVCIRVHWLRGRWVLWCGWHCCISRAEGPFRTGTQSGGCDLDCNGVYVAKFSRVVALCMFNLTQKDLGFEVFAHWWRVLLEIVWIVVEWTVLFSRVELVGVLHHLFIKSVEYSMRYHVVDDNESIVI